MKLNDIFIVFFIIAIILGAILVIMVVTEDRPRDTSSRTTTKTYQPSQPQYGGMVDMEKINCLIRSERLETENEELKDEVDELEEEVDDLKSEVRTQTNLASHYQRLYENERYEDDDDDDDEHDLTIVVRDAETGDPIEDAEVEVENGDDEREFTNSNGRAYFDDLEEDEYDIYIYAEGYEQERIYDYDLDDDETENYFLEPLD
jgi:hypothetical protein